MSDTTGWKIDPLDPCCYSKNINGGIYEIVLTRNRWYIWHNRTLIDRCPTLRECQILAHATARLWAGDTK